MDDYDLTINHLSELERIGVPQAFMAEVYSLAGKAYYYLGRGKESLASFTKSLKSIPLAPEIEESNVHYLSELAKAAK